jgi:hypothetical protein
MEKIIKMKLFFLILIAILGFSCAKREPIINVHSKDSTENVYRVYYGDRDGFGIWIVDGAAVRKNYFNEFVYGGNSERYPFVPEKEIWIDNSISAEEFETTLAHELNERMLMAKYGMTYFDAHDSSLAVELKMRKQWEVESKKHEESLPKVSPTDYDSTQEIESLQDMIKLKNVYRIPLGERNGKKIWIVDGYVVRRDIYPDFGFSGNGQAYHFIPTDEIWIDGQITCEETEYSISLELKEAELMSKGQLYDDAYTAALLETEKRKEDNRKLAASKQPIKKVDPPYRDNGTGREKTN